MSVRRVAFVLVLGFALHANGQIQVVLASNKTTYVAGEPVFVTATMINTGDAPVTVTVPPSDFCWPALTVAIRELHRSDLPACSTSDRPIYGSCPALGTRVTLQPHDSREIRWLLNLIYDIRVPGAYHADLHFDVFQESHAEQHLKFTLVRRDDSVLQAAFAPVLADLNSNNGYRQFQAQLTVLALAPLFAESRIIGWADSPVLSGMAMAALRKLGTPTALEKLESAAFETPNGDRNREIFVRQAALAQIKFVDDESLLPRLLAITAQDRGQMIRWNAASAAARIGHGKAVPALARMLASTDEYISIAGAAALGETTSRDAVGVLIEALPAARGNAPFFILESLRTLTHKMPASLPPNFTVVHQEWAKWWSVHGPFAPIYDPDECGPAGQLE